MARGVAHFAKYRPFDRKKDLVLSVGTGAKKDEDDDNNPTLSGTELLDIIDVMFEASKNSQMESSGNLIHNYYKMDPEIRAEIFKLDVTNKKTLTEFQDIAQSYATIFMMENPDLLERIVKPMQAAVTASTSTTDLEEMASGKVYDNNVLSTFNVHEDEGNQQVVGKDTTAEETRTEEL